MKTFEIGRKFARRGEKAKRVLLVRGHTLECWKFQFRHWRWDRAWLKKWPNHCQACDGYGMGSYTPPTRWEPLDFDPCDAMPNIEECHRCGEAGLDEDGNGPCKYCDWDYDDGRDNYECDCYARRDWKEESIFD